MSNLVWYSILSLAYSSLLGTGGYFLYNTNLFKACSSLLYSASSSPNDLDYYIYVWAALLFCNSSYFYFNKLFNSQISFFSSSIYLSLSSNLLWSLPTSYMLLLLSATICDSMFAIFILSFYINYYFYCSLSFLWALSPVHIIDTVLIMLFLLLLIFFLLSSLTCYSSLLTCTFSVLFYYMSLLFLFLISFIIFFV